MEVFSLERRIWLCLVLFLICSGTGAIYAAEKSSNQSITITLETDQKPRMVKKPETTAKVVVIDPGHGTVNSRGGASGESVINLAVARRIADYLAGQNVKVILTRLRQMENLGAKNPDDDNRIRASIANSHKAKLFLRIHCDSAGGSTSVYYPRLHPDGNLAAVSGKYAVSIASAMNKVALPRGKCNVRGDESTLIGSQNGGLLTGSKFSRVPTVLIELVPLNSSGKAWIARAENQYLLASSIGKTILGLLR